MAILLLLRLHFKLQSNLFSLGFSAKIFYKISRAFYPSYIPCVFHPGWFECPNITWWKVKIKKLVFLNVLFLPST